MSAQGTEEPVATSEPAPRVLSSDQGFWTIAWRQFKKDRFAMGGLGICALLAALAVFSPFLASGLPYTISGVLTNFYSDDVAAFRDWHGRYVKDADALLDAYGLSPTELVELRARADEKRRGLPRILGRMATYLKPEDAAGLREATARYAKLLAEDPTKLDRDDYEAVGREIDEKFGTLALDPAYKLAAGPLAEFAYGKDGAPALQKRVQDALEDLRNAKEDEDQKALALAQKKLRALAPDLDGIAKRTEAGARAMTLFLEPDDAKALEAVATGLGRELRGLASDEPAEGALERINDLSSKIDAAARKSVAPERQRLPRTTLHPVFDYLGAMEVAFVVLYLTALLVIVFRGTFLAVTAALPLDPSDLGLVRLAIVVTPAVLAGLAWFASVPEREPPSDSYYKAYADNLAAHPDPASSISFAPVPYGENENVQLDKVCPPTWIEDVAHLVDRLRKPDKPLPQGVTEAQLQGWLEPAKGTTREAHPQNAVIGPWVRELIGKRLTPYRYHWLGTDKGGRDILARLIMGSRVSLSVGFVSVGIHLLIGIVLGALAGYFRGWVDIVISRFTEILMCIPSFFLILTVIVVMPPWIPAIWAIMLTIGFMGWTGEMRLVRGEFLRLAGLDFVTAGRALGLSNARVMFRHVLPNAMAPVLVAATFGIAGAILTESSLSFLGFGVQPPQASWGSVLNEAFGAEKEMWWVTVFPGFMIFLTITAYNLVGEGFRDATDPRLRK